MLHWQHLDIQWGVLSNSFSLIIISDRSGADCLQYFVDDRVPFREASRVKRKKSTKIKNFANVKYSISLSHLKGPDWDNSGAIFPDLQRIPQVANSTFKFCHSGNRNSDILIIRNLLPFTDSYGRNFMLAKEYYLNHSVRKIPLFVMTSSLNTLRDWTNNCDRVYLFIL